MAEPGNNTTDVLASYRQWKAEGETLKARAQSCLLERFSALVREAQQVQQDLWEDFGHTVKFPANPKFARKAKGRAATRKPVPATASATVAAPRAAANPPLPATAPAAASGPSARASGAVSRVQRAAEAPALRVRKTTVTPKVDIQKQRRQLEKQIQKAAARVEQVRLLGDAVKLQNAEDRLYELNDELRLLGADE